jgi:hypothetical protein
METMKRKLTLKVLLLALACAVMAGSALAEDLRKAEDVIEDFIEATGGRAAYEKHHSLKLTGTFAMPAMGLTAPMTSYQEAPDKGYTLIESQAFGTIESGSDGAVQWEKTMMTGAKVKDGEEKAVADRQGAFNMMLRWQDFYQSAVTEAREDVDGRPCWKLVMTPNVGEPETSWFDVETKLMVKSSLALTGDMGRVTMDVFPSDYREVDGVLVSFVARQVLMGLQEMTITTETLEFNVEIPEGTFDLPEDVKALVKK